MIGKEIGNYKIIKELGRGGMGVVYKAHQTNLGRMVAMKVLPSHLSNDPAFIKRFENEARAIAKLNHPNIVQIYDIGHEGDIHFYTMEFLEGSPLDQVIYREGSMQLERAFNIVLQVARALKYAHGQGIIHRDIKPSNIIMDRSNRVKITDFGLALQERATRLTVDGSIVGTPEYMSPEQAAAESATARSDIYSLGVVFYELITGKIPFEGETALVVLKKIQSSEPQWPRSLNPQIPLEVERVIQRMMAKKPRARYSGCQQLIEDIRRLKTGEQIPFKRKTPAGLKVAVAAVLGILFVAAVIFYRLPSPAETPLPPFLDLNGQIVFREPFEIAVPPPLVSIPPAQVPALLPASPEDELELVRKDIARVQEQLDDARSRKVAPAALFADILFFKKGNKLNCSIQSESLEKIRIQTASGVAEVPRDEVKLTVYATPEEKRVAQEARRQEDERIQQEQQLRNELAMLEKRKDDIERSLEASPADEEALAVPPKRLDAKETDEEAQPESVLSKEIKETLVLPFDEKLWKSSSSCGKAKGVLFEDGALVVTTNQNKQAPCSIVVETSGLAGKRLHSIDVLLEVKRLVLADDKVTASLTASFAGGAAIEYLFFDSTQQQLSIETRQTPNRLIISRPANTVYYDEGWHTLRLPLADDSARLEKGETMLTSLTLTHTQETGKGVFLFRYKAIILNMM